MEITLVRTAVAGAIIACCWNARAAQTDGKTVEQPKDAAGLLGLPPGDRPVVVRMGFQLTDIDEINDEHESFEFTGVLTLQWRDPRQAFDAAVEGVDEKVYQGDYQFNELSPAWYPQVVLVNGSGLYESSGVLLRSRPDGSQKLTQTLNAVAKCEFNMRRFPFDRQSLEAVFEVLGFDQSEVVLELDPADSAAEAIQVPVPQWNILKIGTSVRERAAPYAGRTGRASAFVVCADARRDSYFVARLVMIPLSLIVLLSFSVFWMDRSSLGDRINVSFIGILTGVAYQIVVSELLPRISYVTLMNAFLNLSFLTMCATVVINLVVGALDKNGMADAGNRLDRRCRRVFPLTYVGLNLLLVAVAFTLF